MNQRVKRSQNRKGFSTVATGGHVVNHSRTEKPEVRTPQKVTGDVKGEDLKGLAKASPIFKKITDRVLGKSEKEKAEAVRENTKKVIEPVVEAEEDEQEEGEHYHE